MTDSPKTDINRIKVVLVEQKRTAKWLAEQLHKDQTTGLETLLQIARILDVDVRTLINQSKKD